METNIDYLKMVSRGCSGCIRSKATKFKINDREESSPRDRKEKILKCPLMSGIDGISKVYESIYIPDGYLFVRKKTWTSGRAKMLLDQMDTYERQIKEKARELKLFTPKQLSKAQEVANGQPEDFLINYHILQTHYFRFTFDIMDEDTGEIFFKGIYEDLQDSDFFYGELKEFIIDKQSTLFQDLYPEYPGRQRWRHRRDLAYKEYSIIANKYNDREYPKEPGEQELMESLSRLKEMNVLYIGDTLEYVLDNMVKQDEYGIWKWVPQFQILTSESNDGEISSVSIPIDNNCPTFKIGQKTCKTFEWNIGYPGISVNGNRLECPDYIKKHTHTIGRSIEWVTPYSLYKELESNIRTCRIPKIYKNALVTAFEKAKTDAERADANIREQADTFCRIMTGKGLSLDENGAVPTPQTGRILLQILEDTNRSIRPLSETEILYYSIQQKLYTLWMLIRTTVFHDLLRGDKQSQELLLEIRHKLESSKGICNHDNLFLEYYDILDRNMGMNINDWVETYGTAAEACKQNDVRRLPPYCPAHIRFVLTKIYDDKEESSEVSYEIGRFPEIDNDYLITLPYKYNYYCDSLSPGSESVEEFVHSLKESSDTICCHRQAKKYKGGVRLIRNGDGGIYDWIKDLYDSISKICGLAGDRYKFDKEINASKIAAMEAGVCDTKLHVRVVSKLADFLVNNNYVKVENLQDISLYSGSFKTVDKIVQLFLKKAQFNWNKFDGVFLSKKGTRLMGILLHDAFTKRILVDQTEPEDRSKEGKDDEKEVYYRKPVYQLLLKLANMNGSHLHEQRFQIIEEPKLFDENKSYTLQELLISRINQF